MNRHNELIELDLSSLDFDPSFTFECGQAFRWRHLDTDKRTWLGVVGGSLVRVQDKSVNVFPAEGSSQRDHSKVIADYFTVDHDLDSILESLPKDEFLSKSMLEFRGLRLLTQDPWECLISFVCSINKNIPAIRVEIENLCERFGEPLRSGLGPFHSFPSPEELASAKESELLSCKVGFRWKYIKYIAAKVCSGELDLYALKKLSYERAREILVSQISGRTFGVGPKVADCVLLFSLRKTEAFPIDIWMTRCILKHYARLLRVKSSVLTKGSLSSKDYENISGTMRRHFGKYSGYAQQYLYMKTRSDFFHSR